MKPERPFIMHDSMRLKAKTFISILVLCLSGVVSADTPIILSDDGAWSWFEDERALVVENQVIAGSVAHGSTDPSRRGNVEIVSHDFESGRTVRSILHERFESDDHDSPALWERPDGRILAMYAKHGPENRIYYRITTRPRDISAWEPERIFMPSENSRITYSNLHWLSRENDGEGRLYNFFRGFDNRFKPSWMYSDDRGESWKMGALLIDFPHRARHRPYVKYASDGRDTAHFFFTEGHPRNYDNSVYHAFYRKGVIHRSDGNRIHSLAEGPVRPAQATRIFQGDPDNVAWTHDIALDDAGHPRVVYSVQMDSAELPPRQGGEDHRYRYAVWNGQKWLDREIARAGRRLYAGEDDYTGGICLDPAVPGVVYIATSVHPLTGAPLTSGHYEIFRGSGSAGDGVWMWTPVTASSNADNLRPIMPAGEIEGQAALLWLRGRYRTYTDYDLEVVLQLQHR